MMLMTITMLITMMMMMMMTMTMTMTMIMMMTLTMTIMIMTMIMMMMTITMIVMMILPGAEDVCKDIDECSLKPDICEQGCTNYPGGFDCVCSAGFVVSPDDRTKCLSAGCPPLEPPEFGELNCSPGSPVEGSVCLLECQQGYTRLGKQRRKCLEGGTWEEGSGWCEKISCPPLDLLDHVRASPSDCTASEQNFKTKCRLSCPRGFSFQGSRAAFCGKRGKWVFREADPASTCRQS